MSTAPESPQESPSPGPSPAEQVRTAAREAARDLARQVEALEKSTVAAAKALKALATSSTWDDPAALLTAVQKIEKLEVPGGDLQVRARDLAGAVRHVVADEDRRLRMSFSREMREAASAAGFEFAPLTSDPPEYRLGPLTVVLDFARRSASLRYARLELEKLAARPTTVVEAARRHVSSLEGRDFHPERFFEHLLQAYQVRLHRLGQPFGTRIDLVDLLGELAFALQPPAFFEDPVREKFVPYRRVQLAWDLSRLRRAGRLAHKGMRLSLGAATGGSTKQKAAVLYLEDERGAGQYYLSLRFTHDESAGRPDAGPEQH